jgi:hypothetical protein
MTVPQKIEIAQKEEVKEAGKEEGEEMIKKEVLHYEMLTKYGWEQEGDIVK